MAKFTRKGVHKLECPMCDGGLYATVAQLEARGLPRCWCGETVHPVEIELAILLGADDAPIMLALDELTERKLKAQFPAMVRASRNGTVPKNDMAARALDEIRAQQQAFALWRQISPLLPTPEPMAF